MATRSWGVNHKTKLKMNTSNTKLPVNEKTLPQLRVAEVNGSLSILVGCEESQAVCIELRKLGHEAFSCDLQECSGGHPEWHLQMDVFEAIKGGYLKTQAGNFVFIKTWDMGIFFPDCTYLTCSAEWAFGDGPYHQKVKPGTLVGKDRREAREKALRFVRDLMNCGIPKIAIENPIGKIGTRIFWYVGGENGGERWEVFPHDLEHGSRKPDQIIQPYNFGHPESKSTCLWLKGLPLLNPTEWAEFTHYRCKCGNVFESELGKYGCCDGAAKPLWNNQTKSGQNKLSPSPDRAKLRSKTYPGIAKAMAIQWTNAN